MSLIQTSHRQSEQGFTLVELAIVMVIIGLLIGGILKGQELILNAKIGATVSQLKGLDAALNTFQDKYNAVPGDMRSAQTRLPNCPVGTCALAAANGNSRIDTPAFRTFPAAANEAGVVFSQLNAADLISGIDTTGALMEFGRMLPAVKAGGGMWVSYADSVLAGTSVAIGRHYAILSGQINAQAAAATGALNPSTASQIDRKMDDGKPSTGVFSVVGNGCVANPGANAIYDEANNSGVCTAFSRVLN